MPCFNKYYEIHSMTLQERCKILHDMYFDSENGEAVAMIHLFGVKYAQEIKEP